MKHYLRGLLRLPKKRRKDSRRASERRRGGGADGGREKRRNEALNNETIAMKQINENTMIDPDDTVISFGCRALSLFCLPVFIGQQPE